ncbi:MAG: sugar transferase [Cyanobacteria bacterium SBLK]|nr:sugar transferase [Cyanobacteria bacterium SBLK]
MDGICTLANDRVCDQAIALLNSIEAILGKDFPVCIYPYDDNLEQLSAAIANRPNVEIYSDRNSMATWDSFVKTAWNTHPTAFQQWNQAGSQGYHRFGTHRRYCAFDAPFDRFLYMDADTILLDDPTPIFEQLEHHDCVVYDFQFKDLTHVYDIHSSKLTRVFPQERLDREIFCSGLYASKKEEFPPEQRAWLVEQLKAGDSEILYPMAPDQTLINYMMMRSEKSIYNLALEWSSDRITGCCVTSPHFQMKDNLVYDKSIRLIYLHYIGISSRFFVRLCQGENIDFPYRDIFLYYRYLHEPEKRPKLSGNPKRYDAAPGFFQKVKRKLGIKN